MTQPYSFWRTLFCKHKLRIYTDVFDQRALLPTRVYQRWQCERCMKIKKHKTSMSQTNRLHDILEDGLPHRSDQLLKEVYGSEHLGIARLAARVYDLKKKHNLVIKSWSDPEKPTLTYYKLVKLNLNGQEILN